MIVIAAVVLLNMIVGRLPEKVRQWDLSGTQIYTVGDTTKELLASLDKDVTIYVVADPSAVDDRITSFVNRYADLSDHIKVENVDSVLHPDQVKQLNAENNTILVMCEDNGKTETIQMSDIIKYDQMSYYYYGQAKETEFDGEGQLTSAVSYVTNDVQKNIYVTEGHGGGGVRYAYFRYAGKVRPYGKYHQLADWRRDPGGLRASHDKCAGK